MVSICLVYSSMFLLFSISLFLISLYFMILDYSMMVEFELLSINYTSIEMMFLLDWMSLLFMSFVLFISSMVVYYSMEYMGGDMNINRFILLVSMFVLSMMMMIISPNLISILIGWDGLGLVSYCLVIYYQNEKSSNAGMITALTNRIGDVALLLAIVWMMNYSSWNFLLYLEYMKNDFSMSLISILVTIAAMTKSAQIPFSSWLPAAMAAPTPVSSLVHSSTLVTAGVYLLIRFNLCMSYSLMMFLLLIGSMTMFMAGLGANFEFDLKKIIALSTLSQLGLMMSILSLGEITLAFYHLLTHALFKATLFMCAGNMIHSMNNCQDIRYMGNLVIQLPLTCTIFNVSNLSLCGLPFLSGFYSKDLVLEFMSMSYMNLFIYIVFYISTGLTVSYTLRLIYYTILGNFNFYSLNLLEESNYVMLKSMLVLVISVCFGGSLLMWVMMKTPYFICLTNLMKFMTLIVIVIGAILGYETSKFSLNYSIKSLNKLNYSLFFSSMWNMPVLSTYMVNYYPLFWSKFLFKSLDQGWLEYIGSQNLYNNLKSSSMFMQFLFNNNLKVYLMMLVFMLIVLILMFV
uniref:NADH dehydrogenase subunit 5 n=1 Tax=Ochthephilus vulgaris TaxID=3078931 RepID=UPI002A80D838|nr:NADH dehydrogenase subunit 5 [Ochthephilus vulgaris]WON66024.1 NADH dehydrogenase subunit 5 [Ochthephilus vulgaris]